MAATAIVYFLFLAAWFGIEDESPALPAAFGAGGAALVVFQAAERSWSEGPIQGRSTRWLARMAGSGLLVGGLAPALAAALMLVKISLHSHATPDFTLGEILGLLWRTPIWAGAGALAGLGAGFLRSAFREGPHGTRSE